MMARKPKKELSERHKKILEVLEQFQEDPGYPPSIREICDATDISSTSVVNYYLDQLERRGYIERDARVSRGIRLVKSFSEATGQVQESAKQKVQDLRKTFEEILQIPLLGRIVASAPAPVPPSDFSYFEPDSMLDVARSLLPEKTNASELYALEVQGDSMIDAMVNDGDYVILKSTGEARNGEMVAIWLTDRDETTLKYFYLENGRVRLQPANPTMDAIYIDDPSTVQVQGKVVMVIRQVQGLPS